MRSVSVPLPVLVILSALVISLSVVALRPPGVVTQTSTTTPPWVRDLNRSYNELLSAYRELNLSHESLLNERESLRKGLRELNESYNELLISFTNLKAENERLRSDYSKLLREYDELSRSYDVLKEEQARTLSELNNLRSEYSRLESNYNDLRDRYSKLVDDYNKLVESYNLLKSYHSSAKQVRWYHSEARRRIESNWFKEILVLWRTWYTLKSDLRALLTSDTFDQSVTTMFAEMVRRDLYYNEGLYRSLVHEWLRDHPARTQEELANEIVRLFYSLNHTYANPGVDEPNAMIPMFPIELLAYGLGDCEDHAMLLAALYRSAGFSVRIITVPRHAALQIYLNGRWRFLEATIHFNGVNDPPCSFYSSLTVDDLEEVFLADYRGVRYLYAEV
ncbi:MAG: transglutaminase domain-containing protein [Candidatus Korarchaeum sp.]